MTTIEYGICILSVVPIRAEASDKSEMISQLLFGESFLVIEKQEKWLKVKCIWDHYEGWIDPKQIYIGISENEALSSKHSSVVVDKFSELEFDQNHMLLSIASTQAVDIIQKYTEKKYRFLGRMVEMGSKAIEPIETLAKRWMHTPYLWGGRSIFGIDCSGFTQNVFKMYGIALHRDAYQQAEQGTLVNFIEEVQPGDLAFFDNEEEHIIHVGIILDKQSIIHASGQVRIDRLDHQGIFNIDTKRYSHKLRIIKRMK
jgi:gamma-D-glutamyl-L-lysine dipeptidyl-peptidase